jgi:EAL domain-containing protein (putative c-di-GMP-specific phosphodiesterase class I)
LIGLPISIAGNDIRVSASIGIAIYGADSPSPESLLTHADVALYRAKSEGRGTYRFFTEAMDIEVHARFTLVAELRSAIASGQLFLLYQPQVDGTTGAIIGVEALVRWQHPRRGVLAPMEFIPVAEKSGLIIPLGQWVLHDACRQMKEWLDGGIAPPLVAVNVSAVQFKTPLELEGQINSVLEKSRVPPESLELELTETVLMEVSRQHNDALLRLRQKGMRIAIDDFGTGYSSLDYLRRFPVDRIKIAQLFVSDLGTGSGSNVIVRASIALAQELKLEAIMEGVETAEQLRLISSWGCRQVQGYYFSRPVNATDMTALLQAGKIVPADRAAAPIG